MSDLFGLVPARKEKDMTDLAKWWLVHAMHWALLYGAFVANLDGAMYVLKFLVWALAPVSLLLLADEATTDAAKKPPQPVRGWLSRFQSWVTLALLVWFGHIASGAAWGLVMLMCAIHREATRKVRAATAAGAA